MVSLFVLMRLKKFFDFVIKELGWNDESAVRMLRFNTNMRGDCNDVKRIGSTWMWFFHS